MLIIYGLSTNIYSSCAYESSARRSHPKAQSSIDRVSNYGQQSAHKDLWLIWFISKGCSCRLILVDIAHQPATLLANAANHHRMRSNIHVSILACIYNIAERLTSNTVLSHLQIWSRILRNLNSISCSWRRQVRLPALYSAP